MIDATTARDLVWPCVIASEQKDAAGKGTGQYDVAGAVARVAANVPQVFKARGLPVVNETIIAATGLALVAWAAFIHQCKSIEHAGGEAGYRALLVEMLMPLDRLLTDALNLARDYKQAEKQAGKHAEPIPPAFSDWHEPLGLYRCPWT